jgi:membrane-bound metal-dependent hydrolase YbcI (DUF457 family)
MTSIGHCLMGLSFGVACLPSREASRSRTSLHLAAFAVAANIPDLPLPGWGHDRYDISHSLFVNGLAMLVLAGAFAIFAAARRLAGGWTVLLMGCAAWLSHFFLDATYNHGHGLAVLWPFSEGRLVLSLPWFSTLNGWWAWDAHTARVAMIEIFFYGTLLALVTLVRETFLARRRRGSSTPRP